LILAVKKILPVLLFIFLVSACSILPVVPTPTSIPDTATPTVTFTPTPTIVWFPATATPTPEMTTTVTPTAQVLPQLGEVIFQDPLAAKGHWQTARSAQGGVAFGNDELTVTVASPKAYIFTLRDSPSLSDFYMEVTSISSLCRETDSYGVVFRAKTGRDYYRLVISCAGTVWMERENGGYSINLSDQMLSGQAHPGPETTLRLGLLAQGKQYSVFINGVYQFTASDPAFLHGSLGFFARSGGDTAVTVSFKDLVVTGLK
jgi:hypothetical protein